jgi:hypothetical protein
MALNCDSHFYDTYHSFLKKNKTRYVKKCIIKKFIDIDVPYNLDFPATDLYNMRHNENINQLYLKTRLCSSGDFRVYFLVTKKGDLYLSHLHPKENKGGFSTYNSDQIKSNLKNLIKAIKTKDKIYKVSINSKKKFVFSKI